MAVASYPMNALGGKTYILDIDKGGAAIAQADLEAALAGLANGTLLVTPGKGAAFTIVAVADWTADQTTAVKVAVQGTGTPSTVASEYFADMDVAIVATFED